MLAAAGGDADRSAILQVYMSAGRVSNIENGNMMFQFLVVNMDGAEKRIVLNDEHRQPIEPDLPSSVSILEELRDDDVTMCDI